MVVPKRAANYSSAIQSHICGATAGASGPEVGVGQLEQRESKSKQGNFKPQLSGAQNFFRRWQAEARFGLGLCITFARRTTTP